MRSGRKLAIAVSIMTAVFSAAMLAVPAQAVGYEKIVMYGPQTTSGDPEANCDYRISVENPGVVSLEDDYINMTIYSEPTSTGASHKTMYVLVNLYDGTTNVSLGNKTLACVDDATVWSNLSYNDPLMSSFVTNGTAKLTVRLQVLNTTYKIIWTDVSTFGIYETAAGAAIMQFVPLIIAVAIFAAIIPMLRKIGGKKR